MKKIILSILLSVIFIMALTSCMKNNGNVDNVKINEVSSTLYSKEDIDNAIQTIKNEFKEEWDGCTLKEIGYIGDEKNNTYIDWAKRNNKEEVIVLISNFETDSSVNNGLNPNDEYEDWTWILVRNRNENWKHVDHGY